MCLLFACKMYRSVMNFYNVMTFVSAVSKFMIQSYTLSPGTAQTTIPVGHSRTLLNCKLRVNARRQHHARHPPWLPKEKTLCPQGICQWSAQTTWCSSSSANTFAFSNVPSMPNDFHGISVPAECHCLSNEVQGCPGVNPRRLLTRAHDWRLTQRNLPALDLRLFYPRSSCTWMDILSSHDSARCEVKRSECP